MLSKQLLLCTIHISGAEIARQQIGQGPVNKGLP